MEITFFLNSVRLLAIWFRERGLRADDRTLRLQARYSGAKMHNLQRPQQDTYAHRMLLRYHAYQR